MENFYLFLNRNIYYSLPVYVILDNGVLDPRLNADVYQLLKDCIKRVDYLRGKYFTPVDTNNVQLYRNVFAFKMFTNGLLQKTLVSRMQDAVKEAFESTNIGRKC